MAKVQLVLLNIMSAVIIVGTIVEALGE